MSRSVDERIVEMQFNNKQFEQGIRTSMSTIDQFNKSLNFEGTAKSFSLLERAASSVNLAGLGNAVGTVSERFSALETVAVGALFRIGEKAVDAGERLVKSLSVDQVTAGWSKYAEKTQSVQTIMAATRKDFEDTGEQMEYVNDQLEKLNWFTDETSYNFLEMVNNIGKFTNNNIKLDNAVTDMQGISTWAALAGANSNEASRAMYNLSQAVSVGAVKLQDWKSIENANMATAEFKETAMETAKELGILSEDFEILQMTADKYSGDKFVDVANFSQTLSSGWFTADVLEKTLAKYGAFTNKLYEATDAFANQYDTVSELMNALDEYEAGTLDLQEVIHNTGMTAEEVTAIFDELTSSEMDLGRRGFKAAQEAKTFQEAIEATKDAVSTGWMTTFELMFGDYEKAKKLWTGLANELYDIFAEPGNKRNDILSEWFDMGTGNLHEAAGGRKALNEGVLNYYNNLKTVLGEVKEAFHDIFPEKSTEEYVQHLRKMTRSFYELSERLKPTEETLGKIRSTAKGFFAVVDIGKQAFSAFASELLPSSSAIGTLAGRLLDASASFGDWLVSVDEYIKENNTFVGAIRKAKDSFASFSDTVQTKLDWILAKFNALKERFSGFGGVNIETPSFDSFYDRVTTRFAPAVDIMRDAFNEFKEILASMAPLSEKFNAFVQSFSNALKRFADVIKASAPRLAQLGSIISDGLNGLLDALFSGEADFNRFFDFMNGTIIAGIGLSIKGLIDMLTKAGKKNLSIDFLKTFFKDVTKILDKTLVSKDGLVGTLKAIKESVLDTFGAFQANLKADVLKKIATAIGIMAVSLVAISLIDSEKLHDALGALTTMFVELIGALAVLDKGKLSIVGGVESQMLKLAGSILIMSWALKSISGLDIGQVTNGLIAMTGIVAVMTAFCTELKNFSMKDMVTVDRFMPALFKMATAMLIMGAALKIMGSMKLEEIASAFIVFGTTMLTIRDVFNSFNQADVMKIAGGMLIMSNAMIIMGVALKIMGTMSWEEIGKSFLAFGSAMVIIKSVFNSFKYDDVLKMAAGMLVMSNAMVLMAAALKIMATMSWEDIGKSFLAFGSTMVVIKSVFNGFKSADTIAIAESILILSGAMVVMGIALKSMGSMGLDEIGKGLLAFGASMAIMVVAFNLFKPTDAVKSAGAMLILSAAMIAFGAGLKAMSSVSLGQVVSALIGLAGVFAVFGAAAYLLGPLTPVMYALAGAVAVLGVGLLAAGAGMMMFAAGLTTLSAADTAAVTLWIAKLQIMIMGIFDIIANSYDAIVGAAKTLLSAFFTTLIETAPQHMEMILGLVETMLDMLTAHTPVIVTKLADFIITLLNAMTAKTPEITQAGMNLLFTYFSSVLDAMNSLDTGILVEGIKMVGMISALIVALAAVGVLVPAAMVSMVGVGAVIAELALVLAAIGKLEQIPGINTMIGSGGNILQSVGTAIGKFVGGITGGFASGTSAQFPKIGQDLSDFMTNVQGFVDGASRIDASMLEGVGALTAAIVLLTGAEIIQGLASWFGGKNSLSKFGQELSEFGPYLAGFATSVNGVESEKVKGAAEAMLALAKAADAIPNEGGWLEKVTGANSLAKFGEELGLFGPNLVKFSDSVEGVNAEQVKGAAAATIALAEMAKKIPNEDGLVSMITGDNSIDKFGRELYAYGAHLKPFVENVKDIKADQVNGVVEATTALINMAKEIPTTGGLIKKITGDNNLADFADHLATFGEKFAEYAAKVKDVPMNIALTSGYISKALKVFIENIPDTSGMSQKLFGGEVSLQMLAEEMNGIAPDFVEYAQTISALTGTDVVTNTYNLTVSLQKLADNLPDSLEKKDLEGLGNKLKTFAKLFVNFAATMNLADAEKLGRVIGHLESLAKVSKDISSISGKGLVELANAAKEMSSEVVATFIDEFTKGCRQIKQKTSEMMQAITDGINSRKTATLNAASNVSSAVVNAFKNNLQISTFSSIGSSAVQALANGMNSQSSSATSAARNISSSVILAFSSNMSATSLYSVGANITTGLINGMNSKTAQLQATSTRLGIIAKTATGNAVRVGSPSRVFYKIGEFIDQGLINGITDGTDSVDKASSGLGQSAIDAMKTALRKLADLTEGKMDAQPTIRPTVDLTDVEDGYESIGKLFSQGLNMSASYDKAQVAARNTKGTTNGDNTSSKDVTSKKLDAVIDELRQVRSGMGDLADEMSNYQVVMDTGAVVGQLTKPLNTQMGVDAIRHSRR